MRMSLAGRKVLVTGATGGIGGVLVEALLAHGADVLMTGRRAESLAQMSQRFGSGRSQGIVADLATERDRNRLCTEALSWRGGIDVLINNAGAGSFGLFQDQALASIERQLQTNLIAPMLLTRSLLPHLLGRPTATILNIGSVLGHLALPAQAAYSASKFGLRGFSEALRRELAGTQVRVLHLAPRATDTGFNDPALDSLNAELGVASDPPERVAAAACRMLEGGPAELVIGWPERFFARLNRLLPELVDRALLKQLPAVKRHVTKSAQASRLTKAQQEA